MGEHNGSALRGEIQQARTFRSRAQETRSRIHARRKVELKSAEQL